MGIHRFAFPTAIHFGDGASALVAGHLTAAGVRRPLIVTDKGIAALPLLSTFRATLKGLESQTYSGVHGNPVRAQVLAGVEAFRGHAADAVIGFGGGAALDVAKMVALMAVHPGDVLEYAWDHPQARPIDQTLPYFVALPTTAGTGSEVGRSSVISDDTTHVKRVVFHAALLAKAVFADPALTLGLPAAITAATGMDALTHNVESFLSPAYHPLCDGIALEGVRIAAQALPRAFAQGQDKVARGDMLMASMMGAIAFQKDLGAVHSCAHALSTVNDLHHGLANAMMIEHVMRFNRDAVPAKFEELARAVKAPDFIDWLVQMKATLGIPAGLAALGVTHAHLPRLMDIAEKDLCHETNPRPCTRADFERLFLAAL